MSKPKVTSLFALLFAIIVSCGGEENPEMFQYTALQFDDNRACILNPSDRVVILEDEFEKASSVAPECRYDEERKLITWTSSGLINDELGFRDCDLVASVPQKFEDEAFAYDEALIASAACPVE